jgi:hypothetical protein
MAGVEILCVLSNFHINEHRLAEGPRHRLTPGEGGAIEFEVTRREPVRDRERFQRAVRILEAGFKRAAMDALRGQRERDEERPGAPLG